MLIKNYGLFWHMDRVNWGKPKNAGTLEGYLTGAKREGTVDFRDQRGIYVLYDDTFRIVYVGQAGVKNQCLYARLKQHRTDMLSERWSRFSWFGTRYVTNKWVLAEDEKFKPELSDVLNHLEGILIAAAEPPLNRQGAKFGDAERYLQANLQAK
jgi:hypothetical protein